MAIVYPPKKFLEVFLIILIKINKYFETKLIKRIADVFKGFKIEIIKLKTLIVKIVQALCFILEKREMYHFLNR
jgi:hypothetical protein